MCALISLVILTIRVTYLFSTCPLKLLDCQASIASEENVIVILLFGVFLCILSLACLYSDAWWSYLTTELKLNRNKLQYLGVWAPAQNDAAEIRWSEERRRWCWCYFLQVRLLNTFCLGIWVLFEQQFCVVECTKASLNI